MFQSSALQRVSDDLRHSGRIFQDVVIPEPQHAPSSCPQFDIALVVITRTAVLTAVRFYDESSLNADEIDNEGWDPKLPSEPVTKLPSPQLLPQHPLRVGRSCA
jgi:hypothetical protein